MLKMGDQIYNWLVKKGNILIQKKEANIYFQLDYEGGKYCLLNHSDTYEIINLLTNLSKQIWENPDYVRIPYTSQLYKTKGLEYYWNIENSQLQLNYNAMEDAIELKYQGNNKFNLEINYMVEIIQIFERLIDQISNTSKNI